MTDIYPQLQIT